MNTPGPGALHLHPGRPAHRHRPRLHPGRARRAGRDRTQAAASPRVAARHGHAQQRFAMFDFEPTEEQQALIETARRFATRAHHPDRRRVRPRVAVPEGRLRGGARIGLVNPTLPAEYGGAGLSDVDVELHHRGARVRLHRHPDEHDRQHARPDADQARRHRRSRRRSTSAGSRASPSCVALRDERARRRAATSPGMQCRATKDGDGGYVLNGHQAVDHQRHARELLRRSSRPRTRRSSTRASARSSSSARRAA